MTGTPKTDIDQTGTTLEQTEQGTTHRVSVTGAETRLDRFLADNLTDLSRSRLKALIEDGQVSCAGETIAEPSYSVKLGQTFVISVPEPKAAEPDPQTIALKVEYED